VRDEETRLNSSGLHPRVFFGAARCRAVLARNALTSVRAAFERRHIDSSQAPRELVKPGTRAQSTAREQFGSRRGVRLFGHQAVHESLSVTSEIPGRPVAAAAGRWYDWRRNSANQDGNRRM